MQARPTHARTLGVRGLSLRLSLAAPCGKERVRLEVGVEEEEEDEEKQEEEEEDADVCCLIVDKALLREEGGGLTTGPAGSEGRSKN